MVGKTKYESSVSNNKKNFFDDFVVEEDEKNNDNKISENPSNIENPDNNKDELIKDIIYKGRHTNEFSQEYNKKMKNIILKMYSDQKEFETFNNKNIISFYSGICEINILNNLVNFPFYYLYRKISF